MFVMAHEVSLNGQSLGDVDDRILVAGISSDAGKETVGTASPFGRPGQRITGVHRDSLDITVSFMIRVKKNNLELRSELFEMVSTWAATAARGAWLTCGHRPDRRAWVTLQQLSAEGDPWNWTNTYNIVFRAYEVPYWQDSRITSATRSVTDSVEIPLSVGGNAESVAEITYDNTGGGTCDTFTVNTGSAEIALTGLGCAAGERLIIDHNEGGRIRIRIRSSGGEYRSALACRTPASDDDLWISPGVHTVSITAGSAGTVTAGSYGRWL